MRPRANDPNRVDMAAFAAEGASLSGEWPGIRMPRLADSQAPPQDTPPGAVHWQARGESRPLGAGSAETWLHLQARTLAWLTCQRCLQPVEQVVEADRWFRFVRDEALAETLDAEIEDDVLALPRSLDLIELVEDELLLSLPLVPRHTTCPQPLPMASGPDELTDLAGPAHPFAALAALKRSPGDGSDRS